MGPEGSSLEISWREICLNLLLGTRGDQRGPVLLDLYFSTWSTTLLKQTKTDKKLKANKKPICLVQVKLSDLFLSN